MESETSYVPGERGTSRRTPFVVDTWSGFTCAKDIVRLFPEGKESERGKDFSAFLNNARHTLVIRGRTLKETEALAEEYLRRLED